MPAQQDSRHGQKDDRAGNVKRLKMTGPETKDPKQQLGKYRVRIPLGRDDRGIPRNYEKWHTGTLAEAWDLAHEMRAHPKVVQQRLPETLLESVFANHVAQLEFMRRSPNTLHSYRYSHASLLEALGPVHVGDITAKSLAAAYRSLGRSVSPATLRHHRAVLSAALKHAQGEDVDGTDAALKAVRTAKLPPREQFRPDLPSVADVRKVIKATTGTDRLIGLLIELALGTGARCAEIVGLQWGDIDKSPDGWVVNIRRQVLRAPKAVGGTQIRDMTKGKKDRSITIDTATQRALETELQRRTELLGVAPDPDSFIIANLHKDIAGHSPYSPVWAGQGWRRQATEAGITCRLHDVRHLHATLLLAAGAPVPSVAERMGHASPVITMAIYAHAMPAADKGNQAIMERLLTGS